MMHRLSSYFIELGFSETVTFYNSPQDLFPDVPCDVLSLGLPVFLGGLLYLLFLWLYTLIFPFPPTSSWSCLKTLNSFLCFFQWCSHHFHAASCCSLLSHCSSLPHTARFLSPWASLSFSLHRPALQPFLSNAYHLAQLQWMLQPSHFQSGAPSPWCSFPHVLPLLYLPACLFSWLHGES